jgi:hypothetical protein
MQGGPAAAIDRYYFGLPLRRHFRDHSAFGWTGSNAVAPREHFLEKLHRSSETIK